MAGQGSMLRGAGNFDCYGMVIRITIPHKVIGLVIGKGGQNIKRIQNETGARIWINSKPGPLSNATVIDKEDDTNCAISGTKKAVEEAQSQIVNIIENAATKEKVENIMGLADLALKVCSLRREIIIPQAHIGFVKGRGGENIKRIQNETGALVCVGSEPFGLRGNKLCTITGSREAVKEAHRQVAKLIECAETKNPQPTGWLVSFLNTVDSVVEAYKTG